MDTWESTVKYRGYFLSPDSFTLQLLSTQQIFWACYDLTYSITLGTLCFDTCLVLSWTCAHFLCPQCPMVFHRTTAHLWRALSFKWMTYFWFELGSYQLHLSPSVSTLEKTVGSFNHYQISSCCSWFCRPLQCPSWGQRSQNLLNHSSYTSCSILLFIPSSLCFLEF